MEPLNPRSTDSNVEQLSLFAQDVDPSSVRRKSWVWLAILMAVGLLIASIFLLPAIDYLPEGNRNLVVWGAEPLPGTSIPAAIEQSLPVQAFLRSQPEVDRVLYVDRPGAIRGVVAALKPQFATTQGLSDMIERMWRASQNFAGYRFMVPTRISMLSLVIANQVFRLNVPLDMITALGFLILTGVVVNNSILLVDRALQLQQEGEDYDASLYNATKDRLRAIFMSAGTSVLGMLPLAVLPGQGSELYQGLGILLTGGLAFSTILTPTVVPALMGLLRDITHRKSTLQSAQPTKTQQTSSR